MKIFVVLLFFLFTLFQTAHAENDSAIQNMYVELGPNGKIIARVITKKSFCPSILIDKASILPMSVRATKTKDYSVMTCEAILAPHTQTAEINSQPLALPKDNLKRIVIIGDTGCRVKRGMPMQACDNPKQWPFEKIAAQAANLNPDLIIHLGDYHYRESPCPDCKDHSYGQNWATWQADFFKPAEKLLTTAPWIFLRGNHEDCRRAWGGWFRFLDPFPYSSHCKKYSPLYSVALNHLTLFVMDSSATHDFMFSKEQVEIFTKYFREMTNNTAKNIWLLSHKPIWVRSNYKYNIKTFSTLQKVIKDNLPPQLSVIFSGHIHHFSVLNSTHNPAQIISGNSGTSLDIEYINLLFKKLPFAKNKLQQNILLDQHGFLVLEKTDSGWIAQEYNMNGVVIARCKLDKKQFLCTTT